MPENDWILPLIALAQDLGLPLWYGQIKVPLVPEHLCPLRYFPLLAMDGDYWFFEVG